MRTILCVEDELFLLEQHVTALTGSGYKVLTAANLAQAREHLSNVTPDAGLPDAIVLDIMLPDGNGLEYLKELRAAGSRLPVIMLTAWNKSADIARGLRAGANDYMGKPFTYEVLIARLEAMFRNVGELPEAIEKGPLKFDVMAGAAFLNGEDMLLTQKEFSLLLLFAHNEGRMVSAEYIYEKIWNASDGGTKGTLQKHVSVLRKKLNDGNSGYTVSAVYSEGYRFEKNKAGES
jgi:DNA-binding response OmpR family regulator